MQCTSGSLHIAASGTLAGTTIGAGGLAAPACAAKRREVAMGKSGGAMMIVLRRRGGQEGSRATRLRCGARSGFPATTPLSAVGTKYEEGQRAGHVAVRSPLEASVMRQVGPKHSLIQSFRSTPLATYTPSSSRLPLHAALRPFLGTVEPNVSVWSVGEREPAIGNLTGSDGDLYQLGRTAAV